MSARFDVAIAGGGPVGASLALALSANGYEVALIEPQASVPALGETFDLRTYALSLGSIALLQNLGVWPSVRRANAYRRMRVWEDAPERDLTFDASLVGERNLGYMVEDAVLRAALFERLERSRVQVIASKVASFDAQARSAELVLENGDRLSVSLAVAADGALSRLRELAKLGVAGDERDQRAVVANVRVERDNEATAWQRFTPDGPLAFLPLTAHDCGVVWSVPTPKADALLRLDDAEFRAHLAEAFQWRLGHVVATSPRASFPLKPKLATRYIAGRVALVGDAAHVVLPLAGQGLNLGLLDVAALVESIGPNEARKSRDAGDAALLSKYERWRASDNALAANAFRALDALFRADVPLLDAVRRFGLSAVDRATPVKRELARIASGQSGRVPTLSKRSA